MAECASMSGEGNIGVTSPEDQQKLISAYQLIGTSASRNKGIELLQEAARGGSSEANYRLGSMYLEGIVPNADYGEALPYLKKVVGVRKTAASILIGVVYARGTKNIKPDLAVTRKIFIDAVKELESIAKACDASPGSLELKQQMISTRALLRYQEDWSLLKRYADEFGIALP